MKTRWRTLVVSENATGEALAARLRAEGHHVDITRSGLEAIDHARGQQYLTYFIDCHATAMEGAEVVKEIRQVQPEASIILTCRGPGISEDEFAAFAQRAVSGQRADLHPMSLADMERLLISATLRHTGGNIRESAALLGIDRSTLYEKIKKYGIPR